MAASIESVMWLPTRSVLVLLPQEADAQMGSDMQEIYWGKWLSMKNKGKEVGENSDYNADLVCEGE